MTFLHEPKQKHRGRFILIGCAVLFFLLLLAGLVLLFLWKAGKIHVPEKVVQSTAEAVVKRLQERSPSSTIFAAEDVPLLLGFREPKTYLLLLENNTELRPGGGFIGSYAVVTLDSGRLTVDTIEGSEHVDRATTPGSSVPPEPLKQYLGVPAWYFRDANWSPDFAEGVAEVLRAYRRAGGAKASEIDAVFAITPTVLEGLLRLTGPLTVEGSVFSAETVTQKLQYEVEYAYVDRGLTASERKNILSPFFTVLVRAVARDAFLRPTEYLDLGKRLVEEKQIMAVSSDHTIAEIIEREGAGGRVSTSTYGDYVLWVDANLGALKTDHAMRRRLTYEIIPEKNGYKATVRMAYRHTGTFDWRTTRYQTYARVFVPKGAIFSGVEGVHRNGRLIARNDVAVGEELGKVWYGLFFSVEPGETKELSFSYVLPPQLVEDIKNGTYDLQVQKQLGVVPYSLTLALDFGTSILQASPPEDPKEWGNSVYTFQGMFPRDMFFHVMAAPRE